MAAQLPITVALALAAGFLTSNKAIRLGVGGMAGVTLLLGLFIIILIKLTPSQMKSVTKAFWAVGAFSLLWIKTKIFEALVPYVYIKHAQFPECITPVGWGAVLAFVLAFIVGAHKFAQWTKDPDTQALLKNVFLLFCYCAVFFSVPDWFLGLSVVVVLIVNEFLLPSYFRRTLTLVLLLPVLVLWYPIKYIMSGFGLVVGVGSPSVDEIFFNGTPTPDDAPAAPSPFRRGSRMSTEQVEMRSRTSTDNALNNLLYAVQNTNNAGEVQPLPSWGVHPSGGFMRQRPAGGGSQGGCSISSLSPAAQRGLSYQLQNFTSDDDL